MIAEFLESFLGVAIWQAKCDEIHRAIAEAAVAQALQQYVGQKYTERMRADMRQTIKLTLDELCEELESEELGKLELVDMGMGRTVLVWR